MKNKKSRSLDEMTTALPSKLSRQTQHFLNERMKRVFLVKKRVIFIHWCEEEVEFNCNLTTSFLVTLFITVSDSINCEARAPSV